MDQRPFRNFFLTDYAGRDLVTTARLALLGTAASPPITSTTSAPASGQTVTYVPLSNAYRVATTVYEHPADAHALPLDDDQHGADRAVSAAPGGLEGNIGAGAAGRSRRRQARHGSAASSARRTSSRRRSCPMHRKWPALRQRRLRRQRQAHDRGRRLEGLWPRGSVDPEKRGKLRGIGISNYLETPDPAFPHERVEVTVRGAGKVELAVAQSTGQGHGERASRR